MHISEKPGQFAKNTILTKCSKMTEEGHRISGMNGNVDRTIKEECPKSNYGQGGRLKFFKDGKFILELERAREGERVSWVSVPRKTFWPPQGTASSYRQESSTTSLSVSDDNSSIQSSPWQRDHSWKQTTPRRNVSKELTLFFYRPKDKRRQQKKSKKRRRPHSAAAEVEVKSEPQENDSGVVCVERTNNVVKVKREKREKRTLLTVVHCLINRNFRTSTPPRSETVVSPRKRFLREMEKDQKVQVEENANSQKRSRYKPQPAPAASKTAASAGSPVRSNGLSPEDTKPAVAATARNCSYSITSLLAEDRNVVKRSPNNSPSHFASSQAAAQAHAAAVTQPQYCSPSPEDRWYSESVDRLRSIELSHVEKCGGGGYHHPSYPGAPPHPQSFLGQYMYPPFAPPYYGGGVYGRGFMVPPPAVYHALPMPAVRHEAPPPSCSWTTGGGGQPMTRDVVDHRDDSITDMPLNLSKNSG